MSETSMPYGEEAGKGAAVAKVGRLLPPAAAAREMFASCYPRHGENAAICESCVERALENRQRDAELLNAFRDLPIAKLEQVGKVEGAWPRLMALGCLIDVEAARLELADEPTLREAEALQELAEAPLVYQEIATALGGRDVAVEKIRRGWTLQPPAVTPPHYLSSSIAAASGYPAGWPRCPGCGVPALDGHNTCGNAVCRGASDRP